MKYPMSFNAMLLGLTAIASTVFAQGAEQSNFVGPAFAFALSPSLELRAEYEAITYSGEKFLLTTGKPKQSTAGLAVLYKF